MIVHCPAGLCRRVRGGLLACAAALVAGVAVAAGTAQEEPNADTRSIRPTTMQVTRPQRAAPDAPTVRLASPRPFVLAIGSGYRALRLSGSNLDRVTAVTVVDSAGRVAGGFDARIGSRGRTDDRLVLSAIAGKPAAPGDYSLRLSYELDDPRPATSPARARRKPVVRTIVIPRSALLVQARPMTPRIAGVTPDPQQLGLEYPGIAATIADLPGREIVSVTRFQSRNDRRYCDFEGTDHSPEESLTATWRGQHNLEIRFSPGRFVPRNRADGCWLRFSLLTRNERGEEFSSFVDSWTVELQQPPPDPRRAYRVSNTRDLKKYLAFDRQPHTAVGLCSGTSPGTSGLIPVGLVETGGDIGLRIRSGPIGTKCTWMIYATGLRAGWELRMKFEKQQAGSKCDSGIEETAGGTFQFDRTASLYHRDGVLTLTRNNPEGEIPPYDLESASHFFRYVSLKCTPTVTNDHGVFMRMVSAELYGDGGRNCTWKCGVTD